MSIKDLYEWNEGLSSPFWFGYIKIISCYIFLRKIFLRQNNMLAVYWWSNLVIFLTKMGLLITFRGPLNLSKKLTSLNSGNFHSQHFNTRPASDSKHSCLSELHKYTMTLKIDSQTSKIPIKETQTEERHLHDCSC